MQLCLLLFKETGTSTFLLLLFEPLSIAFDTLQVNLSPLLIKCLLAFCVQLYVICETENYCRVWGYVIVSCLFSCSFLWQAIIVHGMQLLDTWQRQNLDISAHDISLQPSERSAAGVFRFCIQELGVYLIILLR